MSYRPQYAYPPSPRGTEGETFHYSFDGTNTPVLALTLAAGAQANDIMLPLDPDAPFICRGIRIALGTAGSVLDVKLKTPAGDYIETAFVPEARWAFRGGLPQVVALEPEVWCAAGGVWTLYLYNPAGAPVAPPAITFFGIKERFCQRRAA
jgi:hypothetical protein